MGDAQIAGQRQLEPARDRAAVQRGDHRLLGLQRHLEHAALDVPHRRPIGLLALVAGVHVLDVDAGAERLLAGPGQHHDPNAVVLVGAQQGLGQRQPERGGERVAALRAIEGQQANVTVRLDQELLRRPIRTLVTPPPSLPPPGTASRASTEQAQRRQGTARTRRMLRCDDTQHQERNWLRPTSMSRASNMSEQPPAHHPSGPATRPSCWRSLFSRRFAARCLSACKACSGPTRSPRAQPTTRGECRCPPGRGSINSQGLRGPERSA